jgi:hypothetical protein
MASIAAGLAVRLFGHYMLWLSTLLYGRAAERRELMGDLLGMSTSRSVYRTTARNENGQ